MKVLLELDVRQYPECQEPWQKPYPEAVRDLVHWFLNCHQKEPPPDPPQWWSAKVRLVSKPTALLKVAAPAQTQRTRAKR